MEATEAAVAMEAMVAAKQVAMAENAMEVMVVKVAMAEVMMENKAISRDPITLVNRIEVQAHLLILNEKFHLIN